MPFRLGVNLPWLDYGLDFGANAWQPRGGVSSSAERRARLSAVCEDLAGRGCRVVRWFLFCDGRAGIRFAADGTPLGLDEHVLSDLDHAIAALDRHGLRVLWVMSDFHWLKRARTVKRVRLGGHARSVSDPALRAALLDRVFAPVFARYAREHAVWGWDLFNEPEWSLRAVGRSRAATVTRGAMASFLRDAAARAHALVMQPVTVGLASLRGLPLVRGAGLDLYQVHWYDALQRRAPLDTPVRSLGLDRPVLLGEFPTRGSRRAPSEILTAARRAGYMGALAWSVLADDRASDFAASAEALGFAPA
jgi:hypothetical protein